MDIYNAKEETTTIPPHGIISFPTDIAFEPPVGTYARVVSRSSLAFKHNIHVVGSSIDPDYCGNIMVGLINHSEHPYYIKKGDRIAQIVIEKVENPDICVVTELSTTSRNDQGFGSTERRSAKSPGHPNSVHPLHKNASLIISGNII